MHTDEITYNTFIPRWYGRLGNNIQQISNGIYFCRKNGMHFSSPEHPMINAIDIPFGNTPYKIRDNSDNWFYHFDKQYSDFDTDIEELNSQRKSICEEYIYPKLKVDHNYIENNPISEELLIIHIRSGDLYNKWPGSHTQNPLAYYVKLCELFNYKVVFIAEDENNPIVYSFKRMGATIKILDNTTTYTALMQARNIATSGAGSYAISAAFCSKNLKNFYCSNLYLPNSLNPLMLKEQLNVYMTDIDDNKYIKVGEWSEKATEKIFNYNETISFRRL